MVFEQYRDKNGEISRKYGNTLVCTRGIITATNFARGCAANEETGLRAA